MSFIKNYTLVLGSFLVLGLTGYILNDDQPKQKKVVDAVPVKNVLTPIFKINDEKSPIKIVSLYTNSTIQFDVEDGISYSGKINTIQSDNDAVRIGGMVDGGGNFFLAVKDEHVLCIINLADNVSYVLERVKCGQTASFIKKSTSEVVCSDLLCTESHTKVEDEVAYIGGPDYAYKAILAPVPTVKTPIYNSNPSSKFVIFLQFDGATVQDPTWKGGAVINATPSGLTPVQAKTVFDVIVQRFSTFNVNVTTDLSLYNRTEKGYKIRLILTRTSDFAPLGVGGTAMVGALPKMRYGVFPPTNPSWVFTNKFSNPVNIGEAGAHELGHMFGLNHDGENGSDYSKGRGQWAPIMGVGYDKPVVQWSNGDYVGATNKQDDIKMISSYVGTVPTEKNALVIRGSVNTEGSIVASTDYRAYAFQTLRGGSLYLTVNTPKYSGLNTAMEITDFNKKLVYSASPINTGTISAVVKVPAGKYFIKIYGSGEGDLKTGYSNYGSIGKFTLQGTIPNDTLLKSGFMPY